MGPEDIDYTWHSDQKETLNKLARMFYVLQGYTVPEGFDFTASQHPQEQACFAMAAAAVNFLHEEGWEEPDTGEG